MADLLTLGEARRAITSATPTGELDDDLLVQSYIDAAVPMIEELSRPVAELDRTIAVDGGRDSLLLPWPFHAVVSLLVGGVAWTDYVFDGGAGIVYAGSGLFPAGRRNVSVTVSTGVTQVPGNQKLAAQMLFAHLWRLRQGPRPAFNQQGGDVVYTPSGFAVPNAVAELLVATPRLPGFA